MICSMVCAGLALRSTSMRLGEFRNSLVMDSIWELRVAEKRRVCLLLGSFLTMVRMSGMNPMSSMRSASSRTSASIWWKFPCPFSTRSRSLPGVAMRMSTPELSLTICPLSLIPPMMTPVLRLVYLA